LADDTELAALFERLEDDRGFSGVVRVSRDSDVLFEGAYGFANRQLEVPNTLATKFHIASLTKMFTAMAALILVEDGLIALDERPATYLPATSGLDERITLHNLLCHTSGVRDVYEVPKKNFEARRAKNEGMDLLAYLTSQPQLFTPGERWS
jgi:CubicO group peptidase (beta-lactamase class C family)